ncbi:MAG: sensor domain-containing diguanylate cyclase [Deltaproteobacteria bacterium]|nr:sensor domain-containing diguanylate cyclase [Deltaproteobacteria bacterium]
MPRDSKRTLRFARDGRILGRSIVAFLLALLLCGFMIRLTLQHKSNSERLAMEQLLLEKSAAVTSTIYTLLSKTQALAALVIQSDGDVAEFRKVAAVIVNNPAIHNILIAPSGIVADVYPLEGNERLLGYDLLGPGAGNAEARLARDSGDLVIGGPFPMMQGGGNAIVGRLPVQLARNDGSKRFWGLVSVTLKYPQALDGAGLKALQGQGLGYMLWRVNPDTGNRQIIMQSDVPPPGNARFLEMPLRILNAVWYLRVSPLWVWYRQPESWLLIGLGLCASIFFAFIVHNNGTLRCIKTELETMVGTDALTGALNRKGLFPKLETICLRKEPFCLGYIDLNYFKQINDTLGHSVGDLALVEFSRRVAAQLDERHTFARIGGDEFILLQTGAEETLDTVWKKIATALEHPIMPVAGAPIFLTFSRGDAAFPFDGNSVDELIACADRRMYEQKRKSYAGEHGRRRTDWRAGDPSPAFGCHDSFAKETATTNT